MHLRRIDSELVRRGLARSRTQAQELVEGGRVRVDGMVASKPARQIDPAQAITVEAMADEEYASRGAHKLLGALKSLGANAPRIEGRRCLDAGASTGGFTDVLLRQGAQSVVAVDVGYGQLVWALRTNPRVEVHDRTNVRMLTPEQVAPAPGLVVGDLSFISLTLALPALIRVARPDADFLLMVKPQFEIGRERLGHGGVVRDPAHHIETVETVARCALGLGLDVYGVAASPLPGPAGNVEYFLAMRAGHPQAISPDRVPDAIARAVELGPAGTRGGPSHD